VIALVDSLSYYADENNYKCDSNGYGKIDMDVGRVARSCLKKLKIGVTNANSTN